MELPYTPLRGSFDSYSQDSWTYDGRSASIATCIDRTHTGIKILSPVSPQHSLATSEYRYCSSSEQSGSGDSLLWVLQDVQPLLVSRLRWKTGQVPASKEIAG